jgi:hypothetical protein
VRKRKNADEREGGENGVQFPREAASWYKWLPMTVVVLFRSADISASDLPARTSVRSSVLLRRQASMSCSLAEAPCKVGVELD